jgi:hypothetical protein
MSCSRARAWCSAAPILGRLAISTERVFESAAKPIRPRFEPPRDTAFMAQRMEEAHAKNPNAQFKYQWVPYERISPHLKRAVIAVEDAKFTEHGGFDLETVQDICRVSNICGLSPIVGDVFYTTRLVSASGSSGAPFGVEPDVETALARLRSAPP